MSIQALKAKARDHWAKWLPRKTAQLKAAGELDQATHGAAVQAQQEIESLQQQGFRPHEAEEVALRQFILLDPEPEAALADWERDELAAKEKDYRATER